MTSDTSISEFRRPAFDLRSRVLFGSAIAVIAVLGSFWLFRQIDVLRAPMISQKIESANNLVVSPEGDECSTMYAYVLDFSSHPPPEAVRSWRLPLSSAATPVRQFEGLRYLAYSCDGKRIAVGDNKLLKVLDRRTQDVLQQFTQPNFQTGKVWFSPDGQWIASGEWTLWLGAVQLWSTVDSSHWRIDPAAPLSFVAFTADSKEILLVRHENWEVWSLATRQKVYSEAFPEETSQTVAISHDRRLLAVVTNHETVYIWSIDDRRLRARFRIDPEPAEGESIEVCFATDDSLLITATTTWFQRFDPALRSFQHGWYTTSRATDFKVWDTADWNCVHSWRAEGEYRVIQSIPRSRQFLAMDSLRLDVWELPEGLGAKKP